MILKKAMAHRSSLFYFAREGAAYIGYSTNMDSRFTGIIFPGKRYRPGGAWNRFFQDTRSTMESRSTGAKK